MNTGWNLSLAAREAAGRAVFLQSQAWDVKHKGNQPTRWELLLPEARERFMLEGEAAALSVLGPVCDAARALIDALPVCENCVDNRSATYVSEHLTVSYFYCDSHAPDDCPEIPHAEPLRVLRARLSERGSK